MARIHWYFFGDIDCFMRGTPSGTDAVLANELAQLPNDGQGVVDDTGAGGTVPGIAAMVGTILQSYTRDPGVPTWTGADWPLGWAVNFVPSTQPDVDDLILQPGVVAFQWPPVGGGSLGVSIANVQPNLSDVHTIRYGDLLMQTIDCLVTSASGRAAVQAAAGGGAIDDIDLVDLIKKTQPELASGPKALPASFTAEFQEVRQTTKTYLDVNPAGGIHMVLGFKMVPGTSPTTGPCPPAMSETEEPGNVMLSSYPCGGFVLDPSGA